MPLPDPTFVPWTYREILNDALTRVRVHTPEWTNFNDSDPGVTLVQLFAFMTESLAYRANLIPERNRQKFLQLLGVGVRPATAAQGLVVFDNARGPLATQTLSEGLEVSAGKVPFTTKNGLDVLPIETRVYAKSPLSDARTSEVEELYQRLFASVVEEGETLAFYETTLFEPPAAGDQLPVLDLGEGTVDGSAWIALLARKDDTDLDAVRAAIGGMEITLGLVPALAATGCSIYPVGPPASVSTASLIFETPRADQPLPRYERISPSFDGDPLQQPTLATFTLPEADELRTWGDLPEIEEGVGDYPPSLGEPRDQARLITWLRIRSPEVGFQPLPTSGEPEELNPETPQVTVKMSWLGANVARVDQRRHVASELLGAGSGEPDQSFTLANVPVLPESLNLTVNGEVWAQIDDLMAAEPEVPTVACRGETASLGSGSCAAVPLLGEPPVDAGETSQPSSRVYLLDPEAGRIQFGDGARGMRPSLGAVIQVTYDSGGGLQGMVGVGAISKSASLATGLKVGNPIPSWGGDSAETVLEAEKSIPSSLRHRNRLVSKQDFYEVTWRTPGVDLGRVEVLPLVHPALPDQTSEGSVTVVVIPARGSVSSSAPRPDALFLSTICAHLEPRRVVTTELHVQGPVYKQVWLSIGIETVPGFDAGPVREAVETELRRFLSPLVGGFAQTLGTDGLGWPLGKSVEVLELWAAATRVPGVAKVIQLRLGNPDGGEVEERVEMGVLELPELVEVVADLGEAPPIEEIRGDVELADVPARKPVPVIPEDC